MLGIDFVLEIGTEEMPAGSMAEARAELERSLTAALQAQRLFCRQVVGYVAPRRLSAHVYDLKERQEDLMQEVRGPALKVAYDDAGAPTRAAQGFAKSQAVAVEDLIARNGYVYAMKRESGQLTTEVLARLLPGLLEGLHFPKNMRWGDNSLRFLRPIRWLLALYGTEVIPFSLAGVQSGRSVFGHRFLHSGTIELPEAQAYQEELARAGVIVNQEERRRRVVEEVTGAAAGVEGLAVIGNDLLEEVTNLVEHPVAVLGSFSPRHLELPVEVLTTVMAEHQRFFPVKGANDKLLPYFVGVRDGSFQGIDQVRLGYERVLEARMADAIFFYVEDLKEPLAIKAERLKEVIFQEQLGTMYDKACRLQYLGRWIAGQLGLGAVEEEVAVRAAFLAKTDLVSNMVYEFPELQGIMGGYYAAEQGEPPEVSRAIGEHYLPRSAGDSLPESRVGTVLSLADKLDTLVGYWSVGITPTGSQDPFGLRRLASGLCLLLVDKELKISWRELLIQAFGQYQAFDLAKLSLSEIEPTLREFCRLRLANILEERGIRYDVINAVLGSGWDWLAGAAYRAKSLQEFLFHPAMQSLITTYTRARNLSREVIKDQVKPSLFLEPAEAVLYEALQTVRAEVEERITVSDYQAALLALAGLEEPLSAFFEKVLVMAEDEAVRQNRLTLLQEIVACVGQIADLSQIHLP